MMHKDERMRGLISQTAARVEHFTHTDPTRFYDIEAAKRYIEHKCVEAGFTYTAPSAGYSVQEMGYIKDKVHFIVAVEAFKQGEFYTDVPCEDRRALRSAIESDIKRLFPLITTWPDKIRLVISSLSWKKYVF